jgi:dihydroxyacetone kinase-like protein
MKKLINQPAEVVKEALEGMALAYPDLIRVNFEPDFILHCDAPVPDKVNQIVSASDGWCAALPAQVASQVLE